VLQSLNGQAITTMDQLCETYTSHSGDFLRFCFSQSGDKIVLDARKCREIEGTLMRTHAISSIASENLAHHFSERAAATKADWSSP